MNDTAPPPASQTLPAAGLPAVLARIFAAAGGTAEEAKAIAENLVDANLAGHDSHGVIRVPRYLEWVARDFLRFGQTVSVVLENDALVLLEGNNGFGQVLGRQAVEIGLAKAKKHGVALVTLRKAGHLGRIGAWAELAAEQGFVSVHFVNVANSMLVAPFGGAGRRMSTAPVAVGVPNPGGDDFILDFSTAKAAEGKVLNAFKGGKPPPEGSLVDGDGRLTADPAALYGEVPDGAVPNPRNGAGALVAMGDHKGSGLAIACELLAGALTGSGTSCPGDQAWNGMFSVFLRPEAIDDGHGYAKTVADYIDYVRACPPADPSNPVMIPGDPERAHRRERLANGIPLPAETWSNILDGAVDQGLDRDAMSALAFSEQRETA
ncbi:MAG: malate/lactate/ureidoglycolate dehydrogenase [Methyloligellaceae bacterium]